MTWGVGQSCSHLQELLGNFTPRVFQDAVQALSLLPPPGRCLWIAYQKGETGAKGETGNIFLH